ncbi:LIP-domain-containing protein [Myriangium duriaei CBS 260.36]|uniref:LIP-domain-containing protein n=1 Tax=Myriangium duriaei CBS 260.36 TaxID=1168546 RepID=A0A9P4J5Q1_9PEZI|nr:LIP-domain-containing protein [Myriangium duriaei CBS 260.36]
MFIHGPLFLLFLLLDIANAARTASTSLDHVGIQQIPEPANDPFYSPPIGFEKHPRGHILRSREISAAFFGRVPHPISAWQLLYRSTAINGSAIGAVTTVFKPAYPKAKRDRFVTYSAIYNAAAMKCSPSYLFRKGSRKGINPFDNLLVDFEFVAIQAYLIQGYTVSAPDHEGPDAAFGAGRLSAFVVLDSMRAVINFGTKLGLTTKKPAIVGVGYSGGAIATSWAAALQRNYAPELLVKGWAFGGTATNVTDLLLRVDNSMWSAVAHTAFVGIQAPSAYQHELGPIFQQVLTPKGREVVRTTTANCLQGGLNKYPYTSLLSFDLNTMGPELLSHPAVTKVFTDSTLGLQRSETPIAPVLVYHGKKDELTPYRDIVPVVDEWCKRGASVKFSTYRYTEHLTTNLVGLPEVYLFVRRAFAGSLKTRCSRDDQKNTTLNPADLPNELQPIKSNMTQLWQLARRWDKNPRSVKSTDPS